MYTEQQKKCIFCIFGIVYKSGFKYWSNTAVLNMWIIKWYSYTPKIPVVLNTNAKKWRFFGLAV